MQWRADGGREGHLTSLIKRERKKKKEYIRYYPVCMYVQRLCPMPIGTGIAAVPKEKFELLKWMFGVPARRVQGPALACDLLVPAACSATRVFCVSLRGGGRNEMNLLRTALKHAQLPLRSFPLPIHPHPSISISPAGTITQRQPDLTQPALLPSPPFTTDATLCATQHCIFSFGPHCRCQAHGLRPRSDSSSSAPGLGMTLFSTCRGLDQ